MIDCSVEFSVTSIDIELYDEETYLESPTASLYYLAVGGAFGDLLQRKCFPVLSSLTVDVGFFHAVEAEDIEDPEDPHARCKYHDWVHAFALGLVRAMHSGSVPYLRSILIQDNFGFAYFSTDGLFERAAVDDRTVKMRNLPRQACEACPVSGT